MRPLDQQLLVLTENPHAILHGEEVRDSLPTEEGHMLQQRAPEVVPAKRAGPQGGSAKVKNQRHTQAPGGTLCD
jgi:hypothetical protein